MNNRFFYILLSAFITPTIWSENLQIIAIFPVFAQLAQDLGGQEIDIMLLSDQSADPHHFHLTPRQHLQIVNADIIIGPVEITQRLPVAPDRILDISLALNHPHVSQSALHALLQNIHDSTSEHDHHHDCSHEPMDCSHQHELMSITHEWMSFNALRLLTDLLYQKLIEKDPKHEAIYTQRYNTIIHGLSDLKKIYLNKELKKKSIF
jgi:zinc transport system substrate-binding protein